MIVRVNSRTGFTLIELLISIGIFAVLASATIPFSATFFMRAQVHNKTNELVGAIRTAQANAQTGKNDSSWGVRITESDITLFSGASYASRTPAFDHVYTIPSTVSVSGLVNTDILFSAVAGTSSVTGTVTITGNEGTSVAVSMNAVGTVDVQ